MSLRKIVYNPDLLQDTISILNLEMSLDDLRVKLDELREQKPTSVEKLSTLIDRIEFIYHLSVVSQHVEHHAFCFDEVEVVGVDHDIAALRLYLSLTCVDIFAVNFEPFQMWIVARSSDKSRNEGLQDFLVRKAEEYESKFLLGPSFISAFTEAPVEVVDRLQGSLGVKTHKGVRRDIEAIARFLYRIRNKYTHEGRRFHHVAQIPVAQIQMIGPRDEESLVVAPGFDLIESILEVAEEQARARLHLR